jgi:hypothetical protein
MRLYEILVPTTRKDGRFIHLRFHKLWDEKVRAITGGLTILPVNKGQWINPGGNLFIERMIPVRIMCSREDIEKIAAMTLEYYEQEAVMFYCITNEVEILRR